MLIQIDTGPGYTGIWNTMHEMFVPCRKMVVDLGEAWEAAKNRFYDFAKNEHDTESTLSAEFYMLLLQDMDEAHKALLPFKDEWWRARHGYGLN